MKLRKMSVFHSLPSRNFRNFCSNGLEWKAGAPSHWALQVSLFGNLLACVTAASPRGEAAVTQASNLRHDSKLENMSMRLETEGNSKMFSVAWRFSDVAVLNFKDTEIIHHNFDTYHLLLYDAD